MEDFAGVNTEVTNSIPEDYWPCLAKVLIVHGAMWSQGKELLKACAPAEFESGRLKNWITRFLGYGLIDANRSRFCDDHQATAVGFGSLAADSAHSYEFPLPNGLSGVQTMRRVTVSLAWLSPVDSLNRRYRKAQLWVSRDKSQGDPLLVSTSDVDWRTARRGTVQHDVYEGSNITTFPQDDVLKFVVSCKADAGKLQQDIRYALAVTVESADRVVTTVYNEVRAAIRARVQAQTR